MFLKDDGGILELLSCIGVVIVLCTATLLLRQPNYLPSPHANSQAPGISAYALVDALVYAHHSPPRRRPGPMLPNEVPVLRPVLGWSDPVSRPRPCTA